jgi:hypothetical protein
MADNKTTVQVVKLNIKDFTENFKKMQQEVKSGIDNQSKDFDRLNYALNANQNNFKKWSAGAVAAAEEFGKSFAKNLAVGAKALTLTAGFEGIKRSASAAVEVVADLDQTMSLVAAKFNLSTSQVDRFGASIRKVSADTSVNANQMGAAFSELASAIGDAEKASGSMDTIAKLAALGDKDPTKAAKFAIETLQGSGKVVNQQNLQDLAEGAATAYKTGKFNSLNEVEDEYSKIGALNLKSSGLSQKEYGALIGTTSRYSSSNAAGTEALKALLDASRDTFGKNVLFGSLMGDKNGLMTGGKFDIKKLGGLDQALSNAGFKDDNAKISQISALFGTSDEVSNELLTMSRNMNQFSGTLKKAETETDTFNKTYNRATDNVLDATLKLKNKITTGFEDIFTPLKGAYKALIGGRPLDALTEGVSGAGVAAKRAIVDHPLLTAAGLATIAGGGALLGGLGKVIGGGGVDLAKNVAFGKALQQAGVTPVYVVNAADIRDGGKTGLGAITDMLGGGKGEVAKKAGSFLGRFGSLLGGAAGSLGAIGATSVGTLAAGGAAGLSTLAGGVVAAGAAGYGAGQLINMAGDAAFGDRGGIGGALYDLVDYLRNGGQTIEIDVKDPQFSARPRSQNLQRGG